VIGAPAVARSPAGELAEAEDESDDGGAPVESGPPPDAPAPVAGGGGDEATPDENEADQPPAPATVPAASSSSVARSVARTAAEPPAPAPPAPARLARATRSAPGAATPAAAVARAAAPADTPYADASVTAPVQVARAARPRLALHDSAPAAPISQTPVIGATSAARLARAVGAHAESEPDGTQSITFPAPGSPPAGDADPGIPGYLPFSTAPVTVSRRADDLGSPAIAPSASSASGGVVARVAETESDHDDNHSNGAHPSSHAPAAAPALDVDEIADTVIEKLRRELLVERDLGGGAMDLI
jgi:hypothetical protein